VWLRRVATFNLVCLAWVFFRAESVDQAFDVLGRLTQPASTALDPIVVLVVAAALAAQYIPAGAVARAQVVFSRWGAVAQAAALGTALLVIDALGPAGVAPFIYFQF
jgi:hypothetical protein